MPGVYQENISVMMPTLVRSFAQAQVAASQTAVALNTMATRATSGTLNVTGIVMPFTGSVFAIGVSLSAAATVGTFTAALTINGTVIAALTLVVPATSATGYLVTEFGGAVFNVGDTIGVKITTGGTWNGTTSDVLVDVYYIAQEVRA